jgi:hypothetical protein
MTLFHALTDRQADLLSGGCYCEPPSINPSQAYPHCANYGQAKKNGFEGYNPSLLYCGTNYGQSK